MNSSKIRVFSSFRAAGLAAAFISLGGTIASAADYYLTTSNGGFADAGGWGSAPSATNNYFSNNRLVNTAITAANLTFAGDSLTIGNGTSAGAVGEAIGQLSIRNTNNTTVSDLRLHHGSIINAYGYSPTILGKITLTGFGLINPSLSTGGDGARYLRISSEIVGTGELRIRSGNVVLSRADNTYSGGTFLQSGGAYTTALDVQRDGAFGTGNVTMQAGTTLKLNLGTTHNYISDSASLIFATGLGASSVTMSFTGTDIIGGLSFDGGTTWAASGTWGAIGSGAANQHAIFTGTGLFDVVSAIPEPSAAAALVGVFALGCTALRRRRTR